MFTTLILSMTCYKKYVNMLLISHHFHLVHIHIVNVYSLCEIGDFCCHGNFQHFIIEKQAVVEMLWKDVHYYVTGNELNCHNHNLVELI